MEIGADDYSCKPFSPREVVARVKAILRLQPQPVRSAEKKINIDETNYIAKIGSVTSDLTPAELRLLNCLSNRPEHVFHREHLLNVIYDDGRVVTDRTIDTHIKNLRKKLSQLLEDKLIQSIYGVGYKWAG